MTLGQIYWRLDALRGHRDQTDLSELATISRLAHGKRFLEIGSWMGCSTIAIARVAKEQGGKLFCIDAWRGTPADDLSWIARYRDVFQAFWKRICKAGFSETVIPLRGLSRNVLPVLADDMFDFIYIDGDHRYERVKFDIAQAKRIIKPGGTIAGHDYDPSHEDVMRAVNEAFGKPKHEGRVWWT